MGYQPISEYGVVGNDDRLALVGQDGSIDWCCFPHAAAPSVFGRLLDAETGGHFSITPTGSYETIQQYHEHTNVLENTFVSETGRTTLSDFQPLGEPGQVPIDDDPDRGGKEPTYQRAFYRRVQCEEGKMTIEVDFKPRFDYARAETTVSRSNDHLLANGNGEALHLQTHGAIELTEIGGRAVGTLQMEAGDTIWCVLQHDHFTPVPPKQCEQMRQATIAYWREWAEDLVETVEEAIGGGPWVTEVIRSGLVLKLLINEGTGAIYAAATTSLPEAYGKASNWDYRYNWIRDAKFTVQALHNLGQTTEAHQYFEWFREISHEDPEEIQPVYGVHGERDLTEETLDHWRGHRFSSPVRVGNAAAEQQQLDVYGTIIQGLYETVLYEEELSRDDWDSIVDILDHVCDIWRKAGAGIWEFRKQPRHYVHSKLLCWVALDRGIELAQHVETDIDDSRWRAERDAIREAIEERGFSQSAGSFVQHFETDDTLDATCLLLPICEFLPPDDARIQQTLDTVMDELLTDEGLVHRSTGSDVPSEGRGTFLFCSFWLVDALVLADRSEKAREIFTNVLAHVKEPHLLPERIDPATGEYLGNYPQAFSHIGLINSAIYLTVAASDRSIEHDPHSEEIDPD